MAGFLFGYDTGVVGSALPLVGNDLGGTPLSATNQEIITAGTTLGAIFGGLILGVLADKMGRKWCLFIADAWCVALSQYMRSKLIDRTIFLPLSFTVGAVIIASSYSVGQIVAGRLVLGFGVGGAAVIAPL